MAFRLEEGETLLREDGGFWIKSTLRVYIGRLQLTDRRLVFVENANAIFGLLGRLFNLGGKPRVVIERGRLQRVERGSHGRAKNVFTAKTEDAEYKFAMDSSYDDWAQALLEWGSGSKRYD